MSWSNSLISVLKSWKLHCIYSIQMQSILKYNHDFFLSHCIYVMIKMNLSSINPIHDIRWYIVCLNISCLGCMATSKWQILSFYIAKGPQLPCLFTYSYRENKWSHAFSKGINEKWILMILSKTQFVKSIFYASNHNTKMLISSDLLSLT